MYFKGVCKPYILKGFTEIQINEAILERSRKREYFYTTLIKLFSICTMKQLRLIVENPYSTNHYLYNNFPYKPKVIDKNRTLRGDYFAKPTQFWFHNCEPTRGMTYQPPKEVLTIRHLTGNAVGGTCNETRSMISPNYARNFICDLVIGKVQKNTQLSMF